MPEVPETEATFEGNALLKARAVCAATGVPAVSDDSGLCVDALNGMPGVLSARWSGGQGDVANLELVLAQLADTPGDRLGAQFRCAVALVLPDGREAVVHGEMRGRLVRGPRGTNGFGYDPIFVPDGGTRTSAELSAAEKDAISHRGNALRALVPVLRELLPEPVPRVAVPRTGGAGPATATSPGRPTLHLQTRPSSPAREAGRGSGVSRLAIWAEPPGADGRDDQCGRRDSNPHAREAQEPKSCVSASSTTSAWMPSVAAGTAPRRGRRSLTRWTAVAAAPVTRSTIRRRGRAPRRARARRRQQRYDAARPGPRVQVRPAHSPATKTAPLDSDWNTPCARPRCSSGTRVEIHALPTPSVNAGNSP